MKLNIITIDGPSASGKGSLSRNLAKYLDFNILDSGLLYRIYAFLFSISGNHDEVKEMINEQISFASDEDGIKVLKDTNDITLDLRTETTAKIASQISALKITRNNLLDIQRNFYSDRGLVADGRDMGSK